MTQVLRILTEIYSYLARLYPAAFKKEFQEQMLLDFSDMLLDARQKGKFALILFFLHELIDFPINLLRIHLEQGGVIRILRSQPVNTGLRGAVGFSIGFAAASLASSGIGSWLLSNSEPTISFLSVWIYDTFQNDNGTVWLSGVLFVISSALTGVVFGLLFAFLLGNRTKFHRYLIAGALGWVIPVAVSVILDDSFNWGFFLNEDQTRILGYSLSNLPGIFLGAAFIIAEGDRKKPLRYLVASAVIYPLGTFLFIKLLFYLWLEITPWFFIALITFMILLIGSVVAMAMLSDRKTLFVLIAGAFGYHVLNHAAFYIAYYLLEFPLPPLGVSIIPQEALIVYRFYGIGCQGIFGALFGLVLGLILGYQRKNNPPPIAA